MFRRGCFAAGILVFALWADLAKAADPVAAPAASPGAPPRWQLGAMIANRTRPNHDRLLTHINEYVAVNNGGSGERLRGFSPGVSAGLQLLWNRDRFLGASVAYFYSHHLSAANFPFHGWASPRRIELDLDELVLAFRLSPRFSGPKPLRPFIGGGIACFHARTALSIELVNDPGAMDGEGHLLPDRRFVLRSEDLSLGLAGLAGASIDVTERLTWQLEIQGLFMSQLRQQFDYQGSLQYVTPDGSGAGDETNDILMGSYPLELGGLRFNLGFLVAM